MEKVAFDLFSLLTSSDSSSLSSKLEDITKPLSNFQAAQTSFFSLFARL
jgi:hypothetical protein